MIEGFTPEPVTFAAVVTPAIFAVVAVIIGFVRRKESVSSSLTRFAVATGLLGSALFCTIITAAFALVTNMTATGTVTEVEHLAGQEGVVVRTDTTGDVYLRTDTAPSVGDRVDFSCKRRSPHNCRVTIQP